MAESTLNLTLPELEAEAGQYLGWGRGANYGDPTWTDRKQREITVIIKAALRAFYFPAPLPGESQSYDWSFLRPVRHASLISGNSTVDLPDDFGGLDGSILLVDSGRRPVEIKVYPDQAIARRYSLIPDQTGTPQMCAVRPVSTTSQTRGPRNQLYFYPIADQDYELEFRYYFLPDSLITSFPYAQGGTTHAETLRAAVKAQAELSQDNMIGPMAEQFLERLKASVSLDRRQNPRDYGTMVDPGYAGTYQYRYHRHGMDITPVTFGGIDPG